MKKTEKTFFVQNLTEELKTASSAVLVDYAGLSVKQQQELKKDLKGVGAKMQVVKNTLFKIAGTEAKLDKDILDDTLLVGPTALVITEDDPIAPIQVIAKFAKKNELPHLKVGVVEGNFHDKSALTALSKLPAKEILVAQAVGAIAAPMYGIVGVLSANVQNLLSVLKQASEKKT